MGLQARLMSQALRKLTAIVSRSKTTLLFVNQLREKIGMFVGNPEVTTGGRALKFYSSIRLDVRKILTLKNGTEIVGGRTRLKIVKNKLAPPFRTAEVDLIFGKGFSKEGDIIELGIEHEILSKTGSWYSYGDNKLGQGKESVRKLLEENSSLYEELRNKVIKKAGLEKKINKKQTVIEKV
jgi:recombination protein RecA